MKIQIIVVSNFTGTSVAVSVPRDSELYSSEKEFIDSIYHSWKVNKAAAFELESGGYFILPIEGFSNVSFRFITTTDSL
jgi:hypothetical protein